MAVETTEQALALAGDTSRLLRRASEAVANASIFGPVHLGRFAKYMEQLHVVLSAAVPEMEAMVEKRRRD